MTNPRTLAEQLREIVERMRGNGPRFKLDSRSGTDVISANVADDWADELEAIVSLLTAVEEEPAPKQNGCINCGEANEGGYMSGREGHPDEGAVGPFCEQCFQMLQETFAPSVPSQDEEIGRLKDAVESREFYEVMQRYRFAASFDPDEVVKAFEAVKAFVCNRR